MNNALYNQIRIFQSIAREGNRQGALYSGDGELLENLPASVSLLPQKRG